MAEIEGKFTNYKNENLDEFYAAIGIPWVARKMMTSSHPTVEISRKKEAEPQEDQWTVKISSLMMTSTSTFHLGEEYEETMMGGRTIKNVTTIEDGKLVTNMQSDRGKSKRTFELSEDGFIMILTHEKTDIVAKRYFKRV